MKLLLIRHAETDHNVEQRMSGWTEAALSHKGFEQAAALCKRLEGTHIDRLITSGMKRTEDTAALVFPGWGSNIEKMESLKEMNFGSFEGMTLDQIKAGFPADYEALHHMSGRYVFPKGESLHGFHGRIQEAGRVLKAYPQNETLAVVAHSGTIRSLLAGWIARDWRAHWRFRIDHCSVTTIYFQEGYPVLVGCNDVHHLPGQ